MEFQVGNGRVPGLASVIIPSYNKGPYIRSTLESLANQTYDNLELIVVDDASTDNSVDIIRDWIATNTTRTTLILHAENMGLCRTLNDGLSVARGEFISCLGADDRYLPHKTASHVQLLKAEPAASFVYGDAQIEDPSGQILQDSFAAAYQKSRFRQGRVFGDLIMGNFIPSPTVTMRGSALDLVGPYDEALPYEDYDMWLRLSKVGDLRSTETVDCVYVETPGSMSKTLGRQLDIGHLMILSKYRKSTEVARRTVDKLAVTYACRAARNEPTDNSILGRLRDVARVATVYGSPSVVVRSVVVQAWAETSSMRRQLRGAAARVRQKVVRTRHD